MGADSKIQWTHHTFNPWVGCTKVSPGCKNCYAATMANARPALVLGVGVSRAIPGTPRQLPVWGDDAPRRITSLANWRKPLKWNREAAAAGERRRVFCASLADVFEDNRLAASGCWEDLDDAREGLWNLIAETPHLDWLLLTKRPENVLKMVPKMWWEPIPAWPRNVWIGTTVEDQQRADERLPHLMQIPAPVRFVSYEPALGRVDFAPWLACKGCGNPVPCRPEDAVVNWLIVGGESGSGARDFEVPWAWSALRQCRKAHTPIFIKQMGRSPVEYSEVREPWDLSAPHGDDMEEWPEELRVREFPQVSHGR